MSTPTIETEAKFIIPDQATFTALEQLTRLGNFEIKALGVKEIADRYLDTSDKRLFQAGYACRIRNTKGQQTLTVKSLTPATTEVHRRHEMEMAVETDEPPAWPQSEIKNLVLDIVDEAALQTLFWLYQTRYKYHVIYQNQPIIELSLDKVALRQPEDIDYLGLEAELLENGSEANLTLFCKTLQQQWALVADPQSKFERALAIITPA